MKRFILIMVCILSGLLVSAQDTQVSFVTKYVTVTNVNDDTETTRYEKQEFHFDFEAKTLVHILPDDAQHQIYRMIDVSTDEIDENSFIVIVMVKSSKELQREYMFNIVFSSDGNKILAMITNTSYLIFHN
jgi:preprotein translocase subunit SecB